MHTERPVVIFISKGLEQINVGKDRRRGAPLARRGRGPKRASSTDVT